MTAFFRVVLLFLALLGPARAAEPLLLGLDAEFGHKTSTSDEAIRLGMEIAIEEINARGGVLGGRPLKLETRDNRSVPLRGLANLKELAAMPNLVAVFTGKFSPVVLEQTSLAHQLRIPLLDPWAAADAIIDNGYIPNYVFRLSLRDAWAIEALMDYLQGRKLYRVGVLLPNTAWGRSCQAAITRYLTRNAQIQVAATHWYNWGDKSLLPHYEDMERSGARALLLVTNEAEGALLVREMAALPKERRLPVASHWGVSGGDLPGLAQGALKEVDFAVVQTWSFLGRDDAVSRRVARAALAKTGKSDIGQLHSAVGLAHAYDLVHILARAVDLAASPERERVRAALEQVRDHRGLIKLYARPFTPERHEALGPEDLFMARYRDQPAPTPLPARRR